jgi:hypothetical protein
MRSLPRPCELRSVHEDGTAFHLDRIRLMFNAATKRLGQPPIRVHELRRGYATAALEAGVPVKSVSEPLGHSSIGIPGDTETRLGHGERPARGAEEAPIVGARDRPSVYLVPAVVTLTSPDRVNGSQRAVAQLG